MNTKVRICRKCGETYPETLEYFFKSTRHKDGLETLCKKCYTERSNEAIKRRQLQHEIVEQSTTKQCNKCKRILLANNSYFYKDSRTTDKLDRTCIECRGANFILNKEIIPEGYKKCNACKNVFPANNQYFNICHQNNDGLYFQCKECYRKYANKNYKINKTRINERSKINRLEKMENPEYVKKIKELREKAKDKRKLYDKQYRQINREKMGLYSLRKRSLKKQLPSTFTIKQWRECKAFFENTCAYCGKKTDKLTQDHFVALAVGGEYTKNNIVPVCSKCNSMKQHFNFFIWYPKQEFYSKKRENEILEYLHYDKKTKIQQLFLDIV